MSAHAATHVLWLTGVPGIGKTTVIQRVAEALSNQSLGGFYTEEIRQGGVRQGFRLESFRGGSAVIAHVDFPKRYRVARYGVDVAAIDELSSTALSSEPLADIIRDMLQITRAEVDDDSDEETNEAAYFELVEYLRVAAQLAYEELSDFRHAAETAEPDGRDTMH